MQEYQIVTEKDQPKKSLLSFYWRFPRTHIWGTGYKSDHSDISFFVKRKVVRFMYKKNEKEQEYAVEASRRIRRSIYIHPADIEAALLHKVLDWQLVDNLKKAHTSAKFNGTLYGLFLASLVTPTLFRKSNPGKKAIVASFLAIVSRGMADYGFTQRSFDKLIDIYQMELTTRETKRLEEDHILEKKGFDV